MSRLDNIDALEKQLADLQMTAKEFSAISKGKKIPPVVPPKRKLNLKYLGVQSSALYGSHHIPRKFRQHRITMLPLITQVPTPFIPE